MTRDSYTLVHVDAHRQRGVELLTQYYMREHIDLGAFEGRLDRMYRAGTLAEIDAVLADLLALELSAELPRYSADDPPRRDRQILAALMGGTEHKGSWRPARQIYAVAVMGGIEMDFREANFAAGVTELYAFAVMGGVEIVVPPGLRVECDGIGIMGAFEGLSHDVPGPLGDRPTLRIKGLAFWGGVEVKQRYPGESTGEARKRVRAEARERRLGSG